ncbi:MAG: LAGLIDADG family homing endonuclease [archaeon]
MKQYSKRIILNKEICEMIGFFIGDGYLGNYGKRKNQFLIGFVGNKTLDKEYFTNHLLSIIKTNFPFTNPAIRYRNDENTIMLRIYSKELFQFFTSLGFKPGVKSRKVIIPKQICKNKEFLNHTIRGIFDADGCVFLDKRKKYKNPYPRITLQSASIPLINQIEKHLSKDFKLYVNKRNRNGYRNYIEIYGHKQLEKFLKKIGFSNERHKERTMPL